MFNIGLKGTISYDDVTLAPAYSKLMSRSDADPSQHGFQLPIIGSCMDTLGYNMMECLIQTNIPFIAHRAFKTVEEQFQHFIPNESFTVPFKRYKNIWWAVGSVQKYKGWIIYLYNKGVRNFCIDMAHGDSQACVDTIKFIKEFDKTKKAESKNTPGSCLTSLGAGDCPVHIIAGNVATKEGFKRLQKAGANGIRVGIASGSICSTNLETGMGLPVLTSIIECAKVKKKNVWLIADGGIRSAGDIAKAIYFGADFCMIGKLLAATDLACGQCYNKDLQLIKQINLNLNLSDTPMKLIESFLKFNRPVYPEHFDELLKEAEKLDEELVNLDTKFKIPVKRTKLVFLNLVAYKAYHGMASRAARNNILNYAAVEGVEGFLKYSGSTNKFISDTKLRLQSALSYAGATNWKEFKKRVKAYKRSTSAITAADVHMDIITKLH